MDLIDAITAAGIDYRHGRDEDEYWLCCPFCDDDRFRFGVNVITGEAHCFNGGCEWSGRGEYTFRKLQEVLDTGEIEAKQRSRKRKKKRMHIELPEGFTLLRPPEEENEYWNKVAWAYTRKRGITREQIRDKKIGYTVLSDPNLGDLSYRVIFPVYSNGVLVGVSGRDFTGKKEPKWKNSVGEKCIYNLPEKKHSTACLSESAVTALAIEKASKKLSTDSLGLLGHSLKDDQIKLLHHYKRIIVWLDPDKAGMEGLVGAGRNGSRGIYHQLRDAGKAVRVVIPRGLLEDKSFDNRDPDELETIEIAKRLERADVMTDSLVQKLKAWMAFDE